MRKIGIYGGTFDPVHEGHISFALEATSQLQLDKVLLLPESNPPMKPNTSKVNDRLKQIKNMIHAYDNLSVLSLDQEYFSVKRTITILQHMFTHDQLYFLFGSDTVMTINHWSDISLLLKFPLIVGLRSQHTSSEIEAYMKFLAVKNKTDIIYEIVDTDYGHYSSSSIR